VSDPDVDCAFVTLSIYSFIAVITWPDGAPATAWKLTGDVTFAPGVGEQMVTVEAVGVQFAVVATEIVSDF